MLMQGSPRDLATLSRAQFLAFLFFVLALAAWAAASGVHSLAQLRRGDSIGRAKRAAAAPIPFHASLAALAPLLGPPREAVVMRADSAAGEEAALCALARAPASVEVRWIGLSDDVPRCLRALPRADTRVAGEARAALHGARWALVAADRRVLYSHRAVPRAADLAEIAALLAGPGATP